MTKLNIISFTIFFISFIFSLLITILNSSLFNLIFRSYSIIFTPILFLLLFYFFSVLFTNFLFNKIKEGEYDIKNRRSYKYYEAYRYITSFLLNSIIFILPFFFVPFILKFFGSKIGRNNVIGAAIVGDPILLETGRNVILGGYCIIKGSLLTQNKLIIKKVLIGDKVTIGANSLIEPGVIIGNNSMIAPGAYVKMGTKIPDNELWGGVPAKLIKTIR